MFSYNSRSRLANTSRRHGMLYFLGKGRRHGRSTQVSEGHHTGHAAPVLALVATLLLKNAETLGVVGGQ